MKENKVNLFLDSGAFSAQMKQLEINLDDYIKFVKEHEHVLEIYANLDVVGMPGEPPDRRSAEKTLENQKKMEAAGLKPLPAFHLGEPFEFLQYYIDNYDYLALGGIAGDSGNKLIPWLDKCFARFICDADGMPKIKIHGYGITALTLMMRYPWYSVDSTSWVLGGRLGSIYVPRYRNGQWLYDENSWKISVSSQSPDKKEAGKHIDTLPPKQREIILEYVHDKGYKLGKSKFKKEPQSYKLQENERWGQKKPKNKADERLVEVIIEDGISNRYQLRDEMNIIYFQDLEKSLPEWPWAFKRKGVKGFDLL